MTVKAVAEEDSEVRENCHFPDLVNTRRIEKKIHGPDFSSFQQQL